MFQRNSQRNGSNNRFGSGQSNRSGRFGQPSRAFYPGKRNAGPKQMNIHGFMTRMKTESQAAPQPEHVLQHRFVDFQLDERVMKNVTLKGYVNPTPIQDKAIPLLLEGRDVIGLANTGTGKTAAFLLPLINKILADRTQKVLILAPTRELAVQIQQELYGFTKGLNIFSIVCIGGMNIKEQARKIKSPFNFLIGTPGRVIDLHERRWLYLDRFSNIVLDEADRMVDMGFINDMKLVFSKLPKNRQTMFFTATFADEIKGLVQQFLTNPVTVSVKRRDTAANVEQDVIRVTDNSRKMEMLVDLLKKPGFERVLVFGRTKHGVEKISKSLRIVGFRVDSIHGNKSQNYRLKALQAFKSGSIKILIATDIAARGLDIDKVSHVVNYDLPANYDDYVHRIGRTGRAEQKGKAISFVN